MTEARELLTHWAAACDCDWHLIPDFPNDYFEQLETAGYAKLRSVDDDDLENPFACELGIEAGGSVWVLTEAGEAALAQKGEEGRS